MIVFVAFSNNVPSFATAHTGRNFLVVSNNHEAFLLDIGHSVEPHNRSPKAGLSSVVWYGEISPFPSGSGGDLAPQIRGSSENLSHSHISHAKNREAFLFVYRNK